MIFIFIYKINSENSKNKIILKFNFTCENYGIKQFIINPAFAILKNKIKRNELRLYTNKINFEIYACKTFDNEYTE